MKILSNRNGKQKKSKISIIFIVFQCAFHHNAFTAINDFFSNVTIVFFLNSGMYVDGNGKNKRNS